MMDRGDRAGAASLPLAYRRAVARWGEPLGIEEARRRWAELVGAAEAGTFTLIAREDSDVWVALVPLRELTVPLDQVPSWSLRAARPKLGDLVDAAGSWLRHRPVPQVLTRHRRPVVALVPAMDVEHRADTGVRLDADTVLMHDGATITLTYDPGSPGRVGEDGDVVDVPEPGSFMAYATDHCGEHVAFGHGATAIEALLSLYRPKEKGDLPAELYDTDPPF